MEQIKALAGTSFENLFEAFNEAFKDYERQWTKAEFEKMLQRRGYVAELSFGAFENDKLVSFTLNGIGIYKGIKTAYDTGTGTLKEYRGKGLATRTFEESLPVLKEAGIKQYLLEVLQYNTVAVSVYKNIGFSISREFNYFVQNNNDLRLNTKELPKEYQIRSVDLSRKEQMSAMWDFVPSWQNSFEAIERKPGDFIVMGAFDNEKLIAYGIIEPGSGDITQIGVERVYRRQGIGSGILKELLKHNKHSSVKVINTEPACEALTAFTENNGIPKSGMQFEMIKDIG